MKYFVIILLLSLIQPTTGYAIDEWGEPTISDLIQLEPKKEPIKVEIVNERTPQWVVFLAGAGVGAVVVTAIIGVFYYRRNQ